MANTEGMTDEAMASILSSSSSAAASSNTRARSSFLQQRMELPMGERPAATVIKQSVRSRKQPKAHSDANKQAMEQVAVPPPAVLGSVIERPRVRSAAGATPTERPKSHFALKRQHQQAGGFPSVNMPLGTFVKSASRKSRDSQSAVETTKTSNDRGSLEDVSSRDADAMLAQMSAREIQESVQELETVLGPETLAFLRNKRNKAVAASSSVDKADPIPETPIRQLSKRPDELNEKQRIAQVMSSIQTYEDMDAAYEAEVRDREEDTSAVSDWEQTCSLLRSTSSRQSLWAARTVCQRLEIDVKEGRTCRIGEGSEWPHPTLLPVSLRCLLDTSASQSSGKLLHTYVLRSIYTLLRLRAPIDHDVDVTGETESAASVYQECFLDDAVPTPPFGSSYPLISTTPLASNKEGEAVAYSTSSTSTSAQQDGEAFLRDPMWTLLSRMKMIPRLAALLRDEGLPKEALVAVCGILAMLSVRSPGAASAIAQHKTLLPCLLQSTLLPLSEEGGVGASEFPDPSVALPALILLNTMARQSIAVAVAIDFETVVVPLIAMSDAASYRIRKWALILWRTHLRYGLGLLSLRTFVSLSIPELAAARVSPTSLATEFISSFANVLECVKIFNLKSIVELQNHLTITSEDVEVLNEARTWLLSTMKQCVELISSVESYEENRLLVPACLRLVTSYLSSFNQSNRDEDGTAKLICETGLPLAVGSFWSAGEVQRCLCRLPVCCPCHHEMSHSSLPDEAASCAMVDSFISLVAFMMELSTGDQALVPVGVSEGLRNALIEWSVGTFEGLDAVVRSERTGMSRDGWRNQTYFTICKFLLSTDQRECCVPMSTRSVVFSLIGLLGRGDEAKAAILFSDDNLFRSSQECSRNDTQSPLSSMFMKELCSSILSRKQLDHSFKLQRGLGISSSGWGAFSLGSLLSEMDSAIPARDSSIPLLPLGKTWIWQVLSGSSVSDRIEKENALVTLSEADGGDQTCSVLLCCLQVLLDLERTSATFAQHIPVGAKLYFLLNVCLQPEAILRNVMVQDTSMLLLEEYVRSSRSNDSFGRDMIAACSSHSRIPHSRANNATESETRESKVLDEPSTTLGVSAKALRSFKDFEADLCIAFLEYGAQYDFFAKFLRQLLRPQIPADIRVDVINRLRSMLSALSLPEENNDTAIAAVLRDFVLEGLPGKEGCERDPPEVLDLMADTLKTEASFESVASNRYNVYYLQATTTLVRNLIGSITSNSRVGVGSAKRRLVGLPTGTVEVIIEAARSLLMMDPQCVTKETLVTAVVASSSKTATDGEGASTLARVTEQMINETVDELATVKIGG